jgi:hypothetical protein
LRGDELSLVAAGLSIKNLARRKVIRLVKQLLVALGIVFVYAAHAGEVVWVPPATAKWTGAFRPTELGAFKRILADHPITHLHLTDSSGGIKMVAQEVIAIVRERKLSASVSGTCNSACAMAFMASSDRVMLPSGTDRPTKIGIHGIFHDVTLENVAPTDQDVAFYTEATAGKMPRKLIESMLRTKSINGGLMIYESPVHTPLGPVHVLFCDTGDDNSKFGCQPIKGENATSLGVVLR